MRLVHYTMQRCGTGRLMMRKRENEKRLLQLLRECKALHEVSRSCPLDEKAREKWIQFANEHILWTDSQLGFGDAGIVTCEMYKDLPQRTRLVRKMLLDEDVEGVRHMLQERSEAEVMLLDVEKYHGNCSYNIFELALAFDLSIEMVRAIMEEAVVIHQRWATNYRYLVAPFRCEYKWLLKYLELLKVCGFNFSSTTVVPLDIPIDLLWIHTLMLFGVPSTALGVDGARAKRSFKEFQTMLILASAKTIRRLSHDSFVPLLSLDSLRMLKHMIMPK